MIFICSFDPYDEGRYIYTFQNRCDQIHNLLFGDDAVKVVVNTKGKVENAFPYATCRKVMGKRDAGYDAFIIEVK